MPCAVADEVVWILPSRTLKNLSPVLQVLPCLIDCGARKRREASKSLKEHAAQTPVVDSEVVLVTLENLWSHVIRRADNGLCIVDIVVSHRPIAFTTLSNSALVHWLSEWHRDLSNLLKLDTHGLHSSWSKHAGSKAEVGKLDVSSRVNEKVLWLQISVNISQLVESVDRAEHLSDVEACMTVGQDTCVVEESSEITTWDVFHCKIDALLILEGVEEADEPLALGVGQNISLGQDMSDLIEFEQKFLTHDLERADLSGIFLLGKIDLAISSLSNLCENLKITLAKTNTALSQVRTFSAGILVPQWVIDFGWGGRWFRVFCLEVVETGLASADV